MGFSPDRLDVDLSVAFKYGQFFTLRKGDGEYITIFMRVPSEEDINRARVYSLREARKFREDLKDVFDDILYELIGGSLEEKSKDELIELYLISYKDKLLEDVRKSIRLKFPKEPKSEDQELWEEYQKKVDEWPKKFAEELERGLKHRIEAEREKLLNFNIETLRNFVRKGILNLYVQGYSKERYIDYLLYRVVFLYDDMKDRLFNSPEDIRNLPVNVRNQLVEYYHEMSVDLGLLKK